jgi:hypothetical protein
MIPKSWTGPVAVLYGERRRVSECASCEQVSPLICRGLCHPCRDSHLYAGTIEQFGYVKADRLADYDWLTRGCGESLPVAAARIGVSERTAWRYEAEIREAA